jgi:hypothetical protein
VPGRNPIEMVCVSLTSGGGWCGRFAGVASNDPAGQGACDFTVLYSFCLKCFLTSLGEIKDLVASIFPGGCIMR